MDILSIWSRGRRTCTENAFFLKSFLPDISSQGISACEELRCTAATAVHFEEVVYVYKTTDF